MFSMLFALLIGGSIKAFIAGVAAMILTLWTFPFFMFWGIVAVIVIGEIIFKDTYWPIGVLGVGLFLLFLFTGELSPLWETIGNHPYWTTLAIVLYFIAATVWVVFRYGKFIRKMATRRHEVVAQFLTKWESKLTKGEVKSYNNVNLSEIDSSKIANWFRVVGETSFAPVEPEALTQGLDQYLRDSRSSYGRTEDLGTATEPPLWSSHKKDYAAYFTYWPFDLVAYVLGDLIKDIWNWVANRLQRYLDAFARNQMSRPPVRK